MTGTVLESGILALDLLLEKLYRDGGYDFRDYKRGTLVRRLERRLVATGSRTYLEYIRFLDTHPEEYHEFAEYLTIKVSGFFRNPVSFQWMTARVLPELVAFKENRGERSLSLWSAGCACGEEPYSMAILLARFLGRRLPDFDIKIDATDISRQALEEARVGIYPVKAVEGLPDNVLETCFTRCGENFEVKAEIRQMVSFSSFDLTSAAGYPFTDVDCIFCCNVLIYLQKQLQERVLNMLYDSLATPGYLILGEAETLTENLRGRLECIDTKAKIYQKKFRTS